MLRDWGGDILAGLMGWRLNASQWISEGFVAG